MEQFTDMAQRFAQMWAQFAQKVMSTDMGMMSPGAMFGVPSPAKIREFRDNVLGAMASWVDSYLRSPEFVESMRRSLDASMAMREQFNDMMTRMQHSVQGVAKQDTDAVMQAIHHMEQRTLDRLETLADRIDALSRRMDALAPDEEPAEPRRPAPPRKSSRGNGIVK